MEISHTSLDTATAAFGIEGQAEEVTVSTDAEFMMMIAHGIYSNKALAVVREPICNGRDGLKLAGTPDEPLIITLTDNMMTVRDKGTGIPNAIFAKTYMTFGKSTKRKSKLETGGFGVGTKVPWAVCDTFSARNFIDGQMTAYVIMKSDPSIGGKPSCTPIMTIPTQEPNGVEISFPFPERMHRDIDKMIRVFATELNIKVILNGVNLWETDPKLYEQEELERVGYVSIRRHPTSVIKHSAFYVRQGDVIYPIEAQEDYSEEWHLLMRLGAENGPILFMAQPDSIIPTLSRESLQYTERTIKSIKALMRKVLQDLADNLDEAAANAFKFLIPSVTDMPIRFAKDYYHDTINLTVPLSTIFVNKISSSLLSDTQNRMILTNMRRWLQRTAPFVETKATTERVFNNTLHQQISEAWDKISLEFSYLDNEKLKESCLVQSKELRQSIYRNFYEEIMFWQRETQSDPDVLDVMFPDNCFYYAKSASGGGYFSVVEEKKNIEKHKENIAGQHILVAKTIYMSKLVVISVGFQQVIERAEEFIEKNNLPAAFSVNMFHDQAALMTGCRYVRVRSQTKAARVKELEALYKSWGYDVLTLMEPTENEIEERERLAAIRAASRKEALPMLHEHIAKTIPARHYRTKFEKKKLDSFINSPSYKGEPLFFIADRGKELPYPLSDLDNFITLGRFVGSDISVVSTKTETQKAIKQGRRNVEEAVYDVVKWYFKQRHIREKLYYIDTLFAKFTKQNRLLAKYHFNRDVPLLTEEDQRDLKRIEQIARMFSSTNLLFNQRMDALTKACTPEQHYKKLFNDFAEQNFCDVHRALQVAYQKEPSHQRAIARSIIKKILKEG